MNPTPDTQHPTPDCLVKLICHRFCRFYRAGEKEELACGGYAAVEAAFEAGRLTEAELRTLPDEIGFDPEADQILFEWVCNYCEFLSDGCDYRNDEAPPPKVPCGGYIALLCLLRRRGKMP